jgi:hypothetical protein
MSNDDDMLEQFDLSAWEPPPPPGDLADGVIDRLGGTDVGIAVPVDEHRVPRRAWIIGGAAVAALILALGVWSLIRATHHAAPTSGAIVADRARSLSLDTVHADLDTGADVRWRRDGNVLRIEQRTGNVTWHVDSDETLVIDAGAASASVEATGANLRVEVKMNATDARVLGGVALTAAAVAMVTVVVYEGHVKVGKSNQTVVVAPGTTYKVNATDDTAPTVGASLPRDAKQKVAVLGLELVGTMDGDAPVVTEVISASMRAVAAKEGPYSLAPGTDKQLVDVKLLFNCATENPACMAAIGADLGADVLVYGHIEKSGKTYGMTAKLFDVAKKQIVRNETLLMPVADAEAEKLDEYARKLYLTVVGVSTACDADALKDVGMQFINGGQHAAALAKFEESLRCKQDPYVMQLVFMEACASGNSPKAKEYYKQLSSMQQAKFAQMCIRNKVEYQDDTASVADDCKGVDEVACVLNNYEGDCCKKYKQPTKWAAKDELSRADISAGIAKVKSQVMLCEQHARAGGKLTARVQVAPDGTVGSVTITKTPNDAVTRCVLPVLSGAKFAKSTKGSTFSYPFVFAAAVATPGCDADGLKDEGMQNINMGQHAAALAKFEASLRCKKDPYVTQLAFMESCASSNSVKAKSYFKLMTPDQQAKFAQMCERNNVEYADDGFLQIDSKPVASILVDGADTGLTTPIRGHALALAPGKHKITFVVGGERFTYPVVIKPGQTASMSKDLQ